MRFDESEELKALRDELRGIIARTVTDEARHEAHESGTNMCAALYREMGAAGLIGRAIVGIGTGGPPELFTILHELEKASAPYDAISMVTGITAVVDRTANEELKREVLPRLLSGESRVCFGMTEPSAGSDLAGVQTRAEQDGDQWVINGSKVWTTMAHVADYCFVLAKSGEGEKGRAAFTTFFIPMETPGIRIEPIWTMSTERSNSVFFDDVRVDPKYILGEPHGGWKTLGIQLTFERGMGNTAFGIPMLRRFTEWAKESGSLADPMVRDRMAQVAIDNEISQLLTQKAVWKASEGLGGAEGSIAKVFATEAYQRASGELQNLAGPEGFLSFGAPNAAGEGWIDYDARHSVPQTIQGGTSEINRNTIAERHLGLPKTR
jgi:alkylation response protein AidB-like acyl-CoA dehydrogenase